MNSGQILAAAASDTGRSLDLYRDLLQVRSVWGDEQELSRAAELLAGVLNDAGLEVQLPNSGTPGMPMLLARLRGRAGGPTLILAGHMEVYPPSQSWTLDPWGATVRDGRVYGQGAADMKGGTAGMCAAAAVGVAPAPSCRATSWCSRCPITSRAAREHGRRYAMGCVPTRRSSASPPIWRW